MATHRLDSAESATQNFWRPLARGAGWEITAAAQQLGLSLRQLERLCQEQIGFTPRDFFHRESMAEAARLLAAGHPAKIVALQLGYSQLSNFSRDFRQHHGRAPTVFAPRPRLALPPLLPLKAL